MMTNWKSNCVCSYVLWIGSDDRNAEVTKGRVQQGTDGMDAITGATLVSAEDTVRRFPGLPFTWSEFAWSTHKRVSLTCSWKRARNKKNVQEKMRNPWATWEGAVEEWSPWPGTTPIFLTLRYTWHAAKLCASLLQLLNKGSDYFLLNFL